MPRGRPPKPKEGPVEPKKKRAASLALSDAQHIALDKFATDHPEWDQNSVPDELLVGDIFVPFTKKQLIKKIQNHFQAKADQIPVTPLPLSAMDPRTLLGAATAAGTTASTGASPGAASTSSPAPTGGILSLLQRRPPVPVGSAPPAGALGPPTASDRDLQLPDLGENVTVANPFITCCVNDNALLVSGPFISGAEVSVTLESGGRKLKITFTKRPFTFDPNVLDLSDEDRKKAEEKNPYTILQSGALATVRGGAVIPTWTYCASIDTPLGVTAYPRSAGETLKEVSRAGWTFFFNTSPPTMTQTISQPTESPPKKSRTSSRLSTAVPETPAKDTNQ